MKKRIPSRKVRGIHACLEVLKVRPKKVRTIYLQRGWKQNPQLKTVVEQARRYKLDVIEQNKQQLASWGSGHQGVALVVEETPRFLEDDLKKDSSVLVYINGLEDPRNLGAILRTSWLMGVQGIFLPKQKSIQSVTSTVSKVASGGAEYVPVEFLSNPSRWIKKVIQEGYEVYGLDARAKNSLWEEDFPEKVLLIAGSEARGLGVKIKGLCHHLLSIPQHSPTGHYNLSVSIALGLSQVFQTRS